MTRSVTLEGSSKTATGLRKSADDRPRKTIFISHARPEDDELTRWLCGRLTARGYRVWADLTQLRGGDPFWTDIQNTIRHDTIRFLTIITRTSVDRKGVKDELAEACDVARKLGDNRFIVPIKGDDLPWDEFPIQLKQLNGLDFSGDWSKDFSTLLETLERDQVPRDVGDPNVSRIASLLVSARQRINRQPENALLNWLPISQLPERIHYFHTSLSAKDLQAMRGLIEVPCVPRDRLLLSFADLDAVRTAVPADVEVEERYTLALTDFLKGNPKGAPKVEWWEAQNHLSDILRQSFERFLKSKGLVRHDEYRWFVPNNWREGNVGRYQKSEDKEGHRQLVGKAKELTWHFGISAFVHAAEPRRLHLMPQVLFSADGLTPLEDQKQLRRRHCKLWWNDKWRDLLSALLAELFGTDAASAKISLGGTAVVELNARLKDITLPVSYSEEAAHLPEGDNDADDSDDEETDDSVTE
jgi:hypothetical protein